MLRAGDRELSAPRVNDSEARVLRAKLAELIRSDGWILLRAWIEEQQHNAMVMAAKAPDDAQMRSNVARWAALADVKAWPGDTVEALEKRLRPRGEEADG